jgi:cell division protein FtsN
MRYILVALLFLCGCASAKKSDNAIAFDDTEVLDNKLTANDEFDEFDEAKTAPSKTTAAESDTTREINDVEADIQPKAHRSVSPGRAPASKAFYTLQIGAYPTMKAAKKRASNIGVDKSIVSYQEADINGKTWQRVYVGKFKSKKSAMEFQKKLAVDSIIRNVQSEDSSLWH